MKKALHPRVKELQLKAAPISISGSYVDKDGNLQEYDFKVQVNDTDRTVKGYLAVWGQKDKVYGEVMIKGCFARSIAERGPDSASKQKIAFLWAHDVCDPIGRFTKLKEDDYGLYFEAELDNVPSGDRALEQMKSGTVNQFSTGVVDLWDKMEYDPETDSVLVYETVLMEGSAVVFGSDPETYVIKSAQELADKKVELMDKTEDFIRTIPRNQQLELRQLITEHITFTKSQAPAPKQKVFDLSDPEEVPFKIGGYNLNLKQF